MVVVLVILIADDDQGFRGELKRLVEREGIGSVVEAADGEEALRLAQELRPDFALMAITMDGLEATRRVTRVQPATKVIVVTVHDEEPYRRAARESAADGFLVKKTVTAELTPAIRSLVPISRESPAVARARTSPIEPRGERQRGRGSAPGRGEPKGGEALAATATRPATVCRRLLPPPPSLGGSLDGPRRDSLDRTPFRTSPHRDPEFFSSGVGVHRIVRRFTGGLR